MLQDFTNAYVHLRYAALAPSEATHFQQQLNHSLRTARIRI
jgi:hypothetical protein